MDIKKKFFYGQKKKKNNDLQNTTQKTNYQAPRTPQKPGLSSDALEGFEDTKWVSKSYKQAVFKEIK
jgi:hypothetical protein